MFFIPVHFEDFSRLNSFSEGFSYGFFHGLFLLLFLLPILKFSLIFLDVLFAIPFLSVDFLIVFLSTFSLGLSLLLHLQTLKIPQTRILPVNLPIFECPM